MYPVYQTTPALSTTTPQAARKKTPAPKTSPTPTKAKQDALTPASKAQSPTAQSDTGTAQAPLPDAPVMPVTMNQVMWVAFGFTCALIVLSAVTLWWPPKRGSNSRAVMRVLLSLCTAFAATFWTGAAVFYATFTPPLGKVAISGSLGMALFFTVFFFYDNKPNPNELDFENGVSITIAPRTKLRDAAGIIASLAKSGINHTALNADELDAELREQTVSATGWEQLLELLKDVTQSKTIRPYKVKKENGSFIFKITGGVMSKRCPCADPPGGEINCADDQIGICGIIEGKLVAGCFDVPSQARVRTLTFEQRQRIVSNWVLMRVTGTDRSLTQPLGSDDAQIIRRGEYKHPKTGDVVRFSIPKENEEGTPQAAPIARSH